MKIYRLVFKLRIVTWDRIPLRKPSHVSYINVVGHYSGQMRLLIITLTTFLISCSTTDKKKGVFDDFADKETVVIYLSKYNLDSVPKDIGKLRTAKNLYITNDSTNGWTVYPPLSALQQITEVPPFRQLPSEITELTNLQNLGLVGLNLKGLPDNFDKLQKLDSLNLMMNKLTISKEVKKLKGLRNLKYLGLIGNKYDTADINELKKGNPKLFIDSGQE
jgi:Leucine-rich repeat (LRR) protein